jgi:hypothetical protein
MKWIRDRDELIAQTLAFVQSVTGGKHGPRPPDVSPALPVVAVEAVEVVSVGIASVEAVSEIEPPQAAPPAQSLHASTARTSSEVRDIQARIASFRKHQERFEREREEYCAATLSRVRASMHDVRPRPAAEK